MPPAEWPMLRARQLRRDATRAETLIWAQLRDRRLDGRKFRRQQAIGPYIADFACLERRLIVELDGEPHDLAYERDRRRDEWLAREGYRVLRFRNDEVFENLDGVCRTIRLALGRA